MGLLVACSGSPGEKIDTSQAAVTSCAKGAVLEGVDVSHYQGTIDWATAKAGGIAFAFTKATESTDYIDPSFATNWAAMKAAGVVRGAYHFFDASADPTTQATYCLATVTSLEAADLPIVLDFETLNGESEATAVANAVTFLAAVTKRTGKKAILYMSSDFLSGSYPALAAYTLWVANYGVTCPGMPSEWSTWSFWQDSATGTVSGISGDVDLDDFNGTLAQLGGLTGGASDAGTGGGSSSGSSSGGSAHDAGGGVCAANELCVIVDAGGPPPDAEASGPASDAGLGSSPTNGNGPTGEPAPAASAPAAASGCTAGVGGVRPPGDRGGFALGALAMMSLVRRRRRARGCA